MNMNLPDFKKEALLRYAIEKGQVPRYLYKYWPVSSVLRFLGNHKIMFSQYTDFNDPFECAANVDADNSADEWEVYLKSQNASAKNIHDALNEITKNPGKAAATIRNAIHATIINCGIFCMTSQPDNLLMWAHYADWHKGACLKFDLLEDVSSFNFPKAVKYSNEYYRYNYLREQTNASIAIWHKSEDWAYEQEHRVIKLGFHGLCEVNPNAVKEIIFGCRCSDGDKSAIRNAGVKDLYTNLVFRQASMSNSKYQIEIR